jgi:3-dehydroquinate dehydratase
MYMHIILQDGSSFNKKKDLALKANHKNKAKGKIKEDFDSSSEEEGDVLKLALMARKTRDMLKNLNKKGIKFGSKKKTYVARASPSLR